MATSPPGGFSGWYDRTYHDLTGHGLWLHGGEPNTLPVEEYNARPFRVLITRLSTCFDVAESFSHRVLYRIAARMENCFPDLCYLPPPADTPVFERDGIPWLIGTGSKRGPGGFSLIAFSNSILQELINIPVMLEKSGVPLKKSDRLSDPAQPLVLLGGSNALYTSLFFVEEPPVDGIFVGESAECIQDIFRICARGAAEGTSKRDILAELESVPGFFQPDSPKPTARQPAAAPQLNSLLEEAPVSIFAGEAGHGYLQISEGCPAFCSFCAESFGRKPYREVPAAQAIAEARRLKAGLGLHSIDVFSFNFNLHSGFGEILESLAGNFTRVGMKSQRFDALAREPWMPAFLHAAGKASFTCGLEGISARLRRILHKSLSEEDLRRSLDLLFNTPLRELKIFLIITGAETADDFNDFRDLLTFMKKSSIAAGRRPRLIFSATPLVRFPWTPLEDQDAPLPEALQPIVDRLEHLLTRRGHEFRLAGSLPEYALSQMLARARDPRLYGVLMAAARERAFVYYHFVPEGFWESFLEQAAAAHLSPARLFAGGRISGENPWNAISPGIGRAFLARQAEAAREAVDKGHCLGQPFGTGTCLGCGACDPAAKAVITSPRNKTFHQPETLQELLKARRAAAVEIPLAVRLHDTCFGISRSVIGAALASSLMKAAPELADGYQGFAQSFWGPGNAPCRVWGIDRMTLIWDRASIELLEGLLADEVRLPQVNQRFSRWGALLGASPQLPDIWHLRILSPQPFEPKKYFEGRGMPFTLRRDPAGGHFLELSTAALRKKLVKTARASIVCEGTWEVCLSVTSRFDAETFVREAFVCEEENLRARIRIEAEAG